MNNVVLVTGGAGFIGAHSCKALINARSVLVPNGFQPVVYDDLSRGFRSNVKWGPLEVGDIRDGQRLRDVLIKHRPMAVLHFAGLAYVHESFEREKDYFDVNARGTEVLVEAMRETDVSTIIFSSSCATYGRADGIKISELTPQRPINPYGASKLAAETAILKQSAWLRYGLLRYFNAAGADPAGEIGEDHEPETHILPRLIQSALGIGPAVAIFGDKFPTKDGTAVRDFVHVTDLALAHVASIETLLSSNGRHAVNLGAGRGFSILELVEAVEAATGKPVRRSKAAAHPGDPAELVCDAASATAVLGWRPRHSSLKQIVDDALKWQLKRMSRQA